MRKTIYKSIFWGVILVFLSSRWWIVDAASAGFVRQPNPPAAQANLAGGVWQDISDRLPPQPTGVQTIYRVVVKGASVWAAEHTTDIIYRSIDSGATFTAVHTGLTNLFELIFFDELNGVAISGIKFTHTSDGGLTWSTPVTVGPTLYAADFASSLVGYAGGGNGIFYRTADGGTIWEKKNFPFNSSIYDFEFPDPSAPNSGYLVVANAITSLYKTTDGGTTWNYVTLPGITSSMNALEFVSPDLGWAAGGDGEIFCLKDGAWTEQVSNAPLNQFNDPVSLMNGPFLPDGLTGWVVGYSGTILHTTNGGQTWVQQGQNLNLPSLSNLVGVAAVSPTLAFASGYPAISQGDSRRLFVYHTPDYNNYIFLPLLRR